TISSRNPYGIERGLAEEPIIRALTGSAQAYVRSDWFSFAASQGFLYNTILGIPRTRAELERQLGININDNIRRGRVVRAATVTSGVSANNRMVERHAIQDGFL